ncbi:MAG: helix-turn-helix domain-containing protein [Nitrospirae bacterium]|jgi:transcriptional regulator with XRE-family HTH domain/KaiC/GvpD/RAD55 family RecA-like ATPase|nr:helix-turn-helix domain-containing protein [Nitrospirota bacterium]
MGKISSGIKDLDRLIDSLYIGDNVVWEVEAGTASELFVQNFISQSFEKNQNVIYVSFNKSPHGILQQLGNAPYQETFILLDCFTSGKGKNDRAFIKFYENYRGKNVIKVDNPSDITNFTNVLDSLEDNLPSGNRYIFDSLTGMQDLWGDENSTYKFFTYLCPRLYDLGAVAYWILEKEAHSPVFKANLRHITQVVLELYKRKDKLYIKALKLEGRSDREAFKPHPYEIEHNKKSIAITPVRKEPFFEIGRKIKELRTNIGMSQKELADKVDLTPSFISQLENNQINPSLNSFIQICNALGVNFSALFEENKSEDAQWLIKKEKIFSHLSINENGLKGYSIVNNGNVSGTLILLEPYTKTENIIPVEGIKLIYVLKGAISVVIKNKGETLRSGDSMYLKKEVPSLLKNEGGDNAELLLLCA